MVKISVSSDEDLLAFVKEHLQKTTLWSRWAGEVSWTEEKFSSMDRYELLELFLYIVCHLGLYFNSTSQPSSHISSSSPDSVAASILGK